MSASPWNKGILGQKKKILPPNSRESAMPTISNPILLNLSGNELAFEDGVWKQDVSSLGEITREAFEELQIAQQQNNQLQEKNNMLEFKIQLLINMLAVSNSDLETMKEMEKKYIRKIHKLEKQLGNANSPRKSRK